MTVITTTMNPRIVKKGHKLYTFCIGTNTFIPQIPEARVRGINKVATEEKIFIALSMLYE